MVVSLLVITGSHAAKQDRIRTILTQGGELGNADLLACEGAIQALADERDPFHKALMAQVELAISIHNPERFLIVGPSNWSEHVKHDRSIDRRAETLLLMSAQDNLRKAFPRQKYWGNMVLNESELRNATRQEDLPLVFGCIDPRFVPTLLRRVRRRAHLTTLAGATCAVNDPTTEAVVFHQIQSLKPSRIVLRPHMDCKKVGANEDPEEHLARHREHARQSVRALRRTFPGIPVSCRMLDFKGMISLPACA